MYQPEEKKIIIEFYYDSCIIYQLKKPLREKKNPQLREVVHNHLANKDSYPKSIQNSYKSIQKESGNVVEKYAKL